jgi:hypothetical protein
VPHRRARALPLLALLFACSPDPPPPQELGTFPYHPLVYTLDLAILAYQLHCQSLVWPIDPFYEERANTDRDAFMSNARDWAQRRGTTQTAGTPGLDAYRGPGSLEGLDNNAAHDPIIYDYSRLHPWSDAIMNASGTWTEYLTPRALTGRIHDVFVAAHTIGGAPGDRSVTRVPLHQDDRDPDAADVLCAFEGGTGDKGEPGQPASYSLMGFVLARDTGAGAYDVHVAFRGSRSGSAERAVFQAIPTTAASGNPDWITDLGWDPVQLTEISIVGGVSRGFAHAMHAILPNAFQCLALIGDLRSGTAPTNIYVTGHSLGGGLSQHFVSAVLLGDQYGPNGQGPAMPGALKTWPWQQIKLISFSSPLAGDFEWASKLAREGLEAQFWDPGPVATADGAALLAVDPSVTARISDATQPAGFRVLVSDDPITTTKLGNGGNHVGTTVYVNGESFIDWIGTPNVQDHEPETVRQFLVDALQDPAIPKVAWRYRALSELVPTRNELDMGSDEELQKLADGLKRYYSGHGLWFDSYAFSQDVELLFAIEKGDAN